MANTANNEPCQCNALIIELLQTVTAQSNLLAEQNKLMAQIVDQNQMLMSPEDDDELPAPRYLDG